MEINSVTKSSNNKAEWKDVAVMHVRPNDKQCLQ
jgi:hypothetical protein